MNLNAVNNRLSEKILQDDRLDELLSALGCDQHKQAAGGAYRGPCPVHGGDGDNFHLNINGNSLPIWWTCFSHECEKEYKPSLLGLVRGYLSFRAGQTVPLKEAVKFLEEFVGRKAGPLKSATRQGAAPSGPATQPVKLSLTRTQVRARLTPSSYFLGQGFSKDVLDRFDVGHSRILNKSVVPIYDDAGQTCVGYLMRSEKPPCTRCRRCHDQASACRYGQSKWAMSRGCPKSQLLYNFDKARRTASSFLLLVEGPGDVWRADEAGFAAVAPFGVELSRAQAEKLATLDSHVLIAFDNDDAGVRGSSRAFSSLQALGVTASVLPPPPTRKDVGEMPTEAVVNWLRNWEASQQGGCPAGPERL